MTTMSTTSAREAQHHARLQLLHQHTTPPRRPKRDRASIERIPLGSALNGLDRFLEPGRRRTLLAAADS